MRKGSYYNLPADVSCAGRRLFYLRVDDCCSTQFITPRVPFQSGRAVKPLLPFLLVSLQNDPARTRPNSSCAWARAHTQIDQALRAATSAERTEGPPQAEAGGGSGLASARVLLVHSGGDSQRSPTQCVCGKAWSALNSCGDEGTNTCRTPMDLLLDHLGRLFSGESSSARGPLNPGTLVVTACDVMLLIPPEAGAAADWSFDKQNGDGGVGGVAGLAIAADAAKYAPNHGVYCLNRGEGTETRSITGVSK